MPFVRSDFAAKAILLVETSNGHINGHIVIKQKSLTPNLRSTYI